MGKWIKVDETTHRYVSDDDDRPEDTEWVNKPREFGAPSFIESAPWGIHERAMSTDDSHAQRAATDRFIEDRTRTMASSGKWRRWEHARKQAWAKDKPLWRKKRIQEGV